MAVQVAHQCSDLPKNTVPSSWKMVLPPSTKTNTHGTEKLTCSTLKALQVLVSHTAIKHKDAPIMMTIQLKITSKLFFISSKTNSLNTKEMTSTSQVNHMPEFMFLIFHTTLTNILKTTLTLLASSSPTLRDTSSVMVLPTGNMIPFPLTLKWPSGTVSTISTPTMP